METASPNKWLTLTWPLLSILIAGSAIAALLLLQWASAGWGFDLAQKYKHREYYSWRDGTADFPEKLFYIGFNTDRHKRDYFIGKSREEIVKRLPLVVPVPEDHSLLHGYVRYRQLPSNRFAMVKGSYWILEFDDHGICIDLKLMKG